MLHPKQILQTLNQPFSLRLTSHQRETLMKSFPRVYFFLLLFLLTLGSVNSEAQPHPDPGNMQLPAKARADIYFAQGNFKEALELYKSVLEDATEHTYIFRKMVQAWSALGSLGDAETFFKEYSLSHERSSAVLYALGYLQYNKNEDLKAAELFKRATELDPQNGLAWNNWAASLVNSENFQEALKKVKTAIQTNPKELMFFFNMKKIFEKMGDEGRFEEEFKDSLKKGVGSWGYGKVLARSLRQKAFSDYDKGDFVGAIDSFKNMLKI